MDPVPGTWIAWTCCWQGFGPMPCILRTLDTYTDARTVLNVVDPDWETYPTVLPLANSGIIDSHALLGALRITPDADFEITIKAMRLGTPGAGWPKLYGILEIA